MQLLSSFGGGQMVPVRGFVSQIFLFLEAKCGLWAPRIACHEPLRAQLPSQIGSFWVGRGLWCAPGQPGRVLPDFMSGSVS